MTQVAQIPQPSRQRLLLPRHTTPSAGDSLASIKHRVPWLIVIIILGLALRSYHYLSDLPVWHDEAVLIYNVLYKNYDEMLGPLYYSEACPPLFLAVEKVVVGAIGDEPFALRLLPFLASCLSYLVLVALARRILEPRGVLWFALLLGCSDRLLWHATEAKPYAVDVLVASMVLGIGLALRGATHGVEGKQWPWLVVLVGLTPLLVFISFPACFLLGGLALTLAPGVWRRCELKTQLIYVLFGAVLAGSFLVLHATAIQAQKNDTITLCWQDIFPRWDAPWTVPAMAVMRLTEVFRYAAEPVGNVLSVLAIIGAISLWNRGQHQLVGLLLLPLALNVIAWLMSSYPLASSRVVVYFAPAALLLIAAGISPAMTWLQQRGKLAALALTVLLLVPVGQTVLVLAKPWKRLDSATPTAFVLEHRQTNEPVVGTLWEQTYYCRQLGPMYRTLVTQPTEPPSLPPTAALTNDGAPSGESVESLWLLTSSEPGQEAVDLATLALTGRWQIVERCQFRDVVVLHLRR